MKKKKNLNVLNDQNFLYEVMRQLKKLLEIFGRTREGPSILFCQLVLVTTTLEDSSPGEAFQPDSTMTMKAEMENGKGLVSRTRLNSCHSETCSY